MDALNNHDYEVVLSGCEDNLLAASGQ
jgi:hypothetical protein